MATKRNAPSGPRSHGANAPGAPSDEGLLATVVALAALRTLFAALRAEWELQVRIHFIIEMI